MPANPVDDGEVRWCLLCFPACQYSSLGYAVPSFHQCFCGVQLETQYHCFLLSTYVRPKLGQSDQSCSPGTQPYSEGPGLTWSGAKVQLELVGTLLCDKCKLVLCTYLLAISNLYIQKAIAFPLSPASSLPRCLFSTPLLYEGKILPFPCQESDKTVHMTSSSSVMAPTN